MSEAALLSVARDALAAHLQAEGYSVPELEPPWKAPRGVFVTLTEGGRLRGCIGHLSPTQQTLAAEVAVCSVLAGTKDERFSAVTAAELPALVFEISVLTVPEPTTIEALDARRYGVIVTSGFRRGVLLPDLDGVDTPQQQIDICRRKGRIPPSAPVTLERFEVRKIRE